MRGIIDLEENLGIGRIWWGYLAMRGRIGVMMKRDKELNYVIQICYVFKINYVHL